MRPTTTLRTLLMTLTLTGTACRSSSAQAQPARPAGGDAPPAQLPAVADATEPGVAIPPAPPAPPQPPAAPAAPALWAQAKTLTTRPAQVSAPLTAAQAEGYRAAAMSVGEKQRTVAQRATAGNVYAVRAPGMPPGVFVGGGADAVSIISTEPMDAAARTEWQEDLGVMEKLLDDAMAGGLAGPGELPRNPLGIKLVALAGVGVGIGGRASGPMYVEGAGVILTTAVGFPLAASPKGEKTPPEKPRDKPSAWDRAKRELKGGPGGGPGMPGGPGGEPPALPEYDQAKVDALVAALVKVLPEATNFRRLKEDEAVFVTVLGSDDAGAPVRLTLKARKADVDAAARGTISPDEFRARVASRVG